MWARRRVAWRALAVRSRSMQSLASIRTAMYGRSRPAFALLGAGVVGMDLCGTLPKPEHPPCSRELPSPSSTVAIDRLSLASLATIGLVGAGAVVCGHGRLSWLNHAYERYAWSLAYGGLALAAAAGALSADADRSAAVFAPSTGAVLAAVAGERLGSTVGRCALPVLAGVGVIAAVAALHGDRRGERVACSLEAASLVLLPALHLGCLPVYSSSAQSTLSVAWLWLGVWLPRTSIDELQLAEACGVSPSAATRLLLTVGAASMLRTLLTRAPICSF